MSYSGVQPTFGTFPSDLFTANGSNTIFTMSSVPGNDAALLVTIDGVRQHTDTYSYSANTLTFSEAPPNGAVIETVNMGSRADVIITDGVYRKTQFTATAAQTNFNISTGYTVGFVDVYLNGIRLVVADDFTANDGSTIILASAAALGDSVEVVAYGTFNVANALQKSGDTMSGNFVVSGTSTFNAPVSIANTTGNTVVFANTGDVTFNANTTHTGAATFSNTLSVVGVATFSNTVNVNTAIYVADNGAIIRRYANTEWVLGFDVPTKNLSLGSGAASASNNSLSMYAGSKLAINVNANGHVSTSYQPAFFALKNTTEIESSYQAAARIGNWSTPALNVGSYFDNTTGRFTAPVSGSYVFSLNVMHSGQTVGDVQHRWYKNGGLYAGSNHTAQGGAWTETTVTCVMYLSAGDYAEPWTYSGNAGSSTRELVYGGSYSHVSGYYLG